MEIHYNYIPSNLDIEKISLSIPKGSKLNQDKLAFLISTILKVGTANRQKVEGKDGYVTLHSTLLQKYVSNYKMAVELLEKNGVISVRRSYEPGVTSMKYRIEDKYVTTVTALPITDKRFSHTFQKSLITKTKTTVPYSILDKWINSEEFVFNDTLAEEILKGLYSKSSTLDQRKIQFASCAIAQIRNKEFSCGRDKTSGRYHSNLTNLKSEFRKCFNFKGEKLIQIDIKNSQLFLMTAIMKEEFWKEGVNKLEYYKKYRKGVNYIMLGLSPVSPMPTDLQTFLDLVAKGGMYEDFMKKILQHNGKSLTRDQVKRTVLRTAYSSNQWRGAREKYPAYDAADKELFIKFYPTVYKVMEVIKQKDKEALAILLQNIESYLIIDVCCKRISKEEPDCPIFTIHDSISTIPEYVDYVKSVILEEFEKFVGEQPSLKTEIWE